MKYLFGRVKARQYKSYSQVTLISWARRIAIHYCLAFFIGSLVGWVGQAAQAQEVPSLIPYRNAEEKWGYCNAAKEIVIPCVYDKAYPFGNGVAWVWVYEQGYGLINAAGKQLYPPRSALPMMFAVTEKRTPVKENGKIGFITPEGKIAISPRYEDAYYCAAEDVIIFANHQKWGVANIAGKLLLPATYDDLGQFVDRLARAKQGSRWGFISKDGSWVLPAIYDTVGDFADGYAPVKSSEGWTYIDVSGKKIVDVWADSAMVFSGGVGVLLIEGTYSFLDKGFDVTAIQDFKAVFPFEKGLAVAQHKDGKYGVVNAEGEWVLKPVFTNMGTKVVGGIVPAEAEGKWGYVNIEGKWILPPRYDYTFDFKQGLGEVWMLMEDGTVSSGFIDRKGTAYWDPKGVQDKP